MATKDIILKITGKTLSTLPKNPDGLEDDSIEFLTEGTLSERGQITKISYQESEFSGMPGYETTLALSPGKVKMTRKNPEDEKSTVMLFQVGMRSYGYYQTPYGTIEMEILADSISDFEDIGENRKKLVIEYSISLKGLLEARKMISIEIIEKNE